MTDKKPGTMLTSPEGWHVEKENGQWRVWQLTEGLQGPATWVDSPVLADYFDAIAAESEAAAPINIQPRIAALPSEVDRLNSSTALCSHTVEVNGLHLYCSFMVHEHIASLKAEVERLKGQPAQCEAVAVVTDCVTQEIAPNVWEWRAGEFSTDRKLPIGTRLYTAPPAPSDAQIDKLMTEIGATAECHAKHWGLPMYGKWPEFYREQLRAMLAAAPEVKP